MSKIQIILYLCVLLELNIIRLFFYKIILNPPLGNSYIMNKTPFNKNVYKYYG